MTISTLFSATMVAMVRRVKSFFPRGALAAVAVGLAVGAVLVGCSETSSDGTTPTVSFAASTASMVTEEGATATEVTVNASAYSRQRRAGYHPYGCPQRHRYGRRQERTISCRVPMARRCASNAGQRLYACADWTERDISG